MDASIEKIRERNGDRASPADMPEKRFWKCLPFDTGRFSWRLALHLE
jgi:hypothetical protein